MFNFEKNKLLIFSKAIIFIALFFCFNKDVLASDNSIMDGFPFVVDNNFSSFNGLTDGFSALSLKSDNPFSDPYDRSLQSVNNQANSPNQISSNIGPIPGNGFSVSWWFKWAGYSGSLSLDVNDASGHILLGAYLGKYVNKIHIPYGANNINWDYYNLTESQMGDGNWHQFILTSNGSDIELYFDGQQVASGIYENPINYTGREIKYIRLAGSGTKRFDEIIFWDKYITFGDANSIYLHGSFADKIEKEEPVYIEPGKISNVIMDGFPFNADNNFDSFNGLTDGFSALFFESDNPFSDPYDRSLLARNNQVNLPSQLSSNIGPIPGNGFSVSWWFKWAGYSGSLSLDVNDASGHILLGAYLGRNANQVYVPYGAEGIFWSDYNLTEGQMGDGNWHQFILTSNGVDIGLYFDGQQVATGTYNNIVDYKDREIKNIRIGGSGTKRFDEIVLWNKYLTLNDANLIYSLDSLTDDYFKKRNPVIIVPGIIASYLNNKATGEEIWPNIEKMIGPNDKYLDELILDNDGLGDNNIYPSNIIKKIIIEDLFDGLIKELENDGYQEYNQETKEGNLFVFPYDWRLDLNIIAGDDSLLPEINTLREMIENVKASTSAEKVNIIAHSMGGLVVKTYIANYESEGVRNNIDKFIDMATPHLGAPKAFKILNHGDSLGFRFGAESFGIGLDSERIFIISQNMPSMYQLLPSRNYFNPQNDDYKYYFSDNFDLDKNLKINELNYDNTLEFMSNMGRNYNLIQYNDELHSKIDEIEIDNSYNIVGCGVSTIGQIEALNWKYIFDFDQNIAEEKIEMNIDMIDGDGTVPLESADAFGQTKYYVKKVKHHKIPSANGVKELVIAILNEEENFDINEYDNLVDKSSCFISGKLFGLFSPVELHVYDNQGNHTGPDENGEIEMNIPGVEYEIIEENKFVFLPRGGDYKVVGKATDIGTFDVRIKTIDENQYTEIAYFSETPIMSTSTNFEMNIIEEQEEYIMKIDNDGDDIFESEIEPDSILDEEEAKDKIKPETEINISGQEGNNNYYISDIEIELISQDNDNGSGILNTKYSLDNGKIWQEYDNPINVSENGTTSILYYAIDMAGNKENIKTGIIKIDKTGPEILILTPSEINRNEVLNIEYILDDNYSGVATDTIEIYFDNESATKTIDLFYKDLGEHEVKITVEDSAGNKTEETVEIDIITDINGTIVDVERSYIEELTNKKAKNKLIKDLKRIRKYIEKYGERIEEREEKHEELMERCIEKKGEEFCEEKLGEIFDKIDYKLNKIHQIILKIKYNEILRKLSFYKRLGWVTEEGYGIIKEDLEYLINNIK